MDEEIDTNKFMEMLKELNERLLDSDLQNPRLYYKDINCKRLINLVVDSSDFYAKYMLNTFKIFQDVSKKYDLINNDIAIMFYEKEEVKFSFEDEGFTGFNSEEDIMVINKDEKIVQLEEEIDEYKRTIAILMDKEIMKQLKDKNGKVIEFEELAKELDI